MARLRRSSPLQPRAVRLSPPDWPRGGSGLITPVGDEGGRGQRGPRATPHPVGEGEWVACRTAWPASTSPVPPPAPGQPGRLAGVGGRGVRGGTEPRRAGAAVRRVRRLPLVPRHGARVVRGRRGGRRRQRRTSSPSRSTARSAPTSTPSTWPRRPGPDGPRRVADDLLPHARRRAVLRRHLPTQAAAALPARQPSRGVARPTLAGARVGRATSPRRLREVTGPPAPSAIGADTCDAAVPALPVGRTTWPGAGSVARRSSRRRWCSSSCCATTRARARPDGPAPWSGGTCEAMARGGMYDQLGGGFARYSVDAAGWSRTSRRCSTTTRCCCACTPTSGARPATRSLAASRRRPPAFLLRDLRTPEGGFASALDADTRRALAEGLTYAWTPAQLIEVLGDDDGAWAARAPRCHVRRHLRARHVDAPAARGPRRPAPGGQRVRARLLAARDAGARSPPATTRSSPPGTASPWSRSPTRATLLDRPDLVEAAAKAAAFVVGTHDVDGTLQAHVAWWRRRSRPCRPRRPRGPRGGPPRPPPGHGCATLGGAGGRAARPGAGAVRRRRRHPPRHGARRTRAVLAAREPGGQCRAVGRRRAGGSPPDPCRADGLDAAPGRRRGRPRGVRLGRCP